MNFRTYIRRQTTIKEMVENAMPTAAIVGALVSAFGLTVLKVQPIVQVSCSRESNLEVSRRKWSTILLQGAGF
jgi:hypothetical protein